jgi:dihydrofolate reductase
VRRLRYNVASSLDGFIADRQGEFDWIPNDSAVDFASLFATVDTVLIGRRTYDVVRGMGSPPWKRSTRVYVVSQTMRDADHPGVTIVRDDPITTATALRSESGTGDIWLFGGGELFAALLEGNQVDSVEVTIVPILLGGGVPLLPPISGRRTLSLAYSQVYPSGMVALHYDVRDPAPVGT